MSVPAPEFIAPRPGQLRASDRPVRLFDLPAELLTPHITYDAPWGQVTVTIETITPEIADGWLRNMNWHNRSLGVDRSAAHARDMKAGLWRFIGDSIRFATTERLDETTGQYVEAEVLVDGQHRLDAIRQSGEEQVYIVVRGLTLDAQEVIDTNKLRSFGDFLRMDDPKAEQVKDEKFASSLTRRLLLWERDIILGGTTHTKGSTGRAARIATMPELRRYFDEHRAEIVAAHKIKASVGGNGFSISPAVLATAWVLCARKDQAGADLFFIDNLIKMVGMGNEEGHPARQLRKRLTRTDRWRVKPAEGLLLSLHAWNLWRDGRLVDKLLPMREWPKPSEFVIR